MNLIHHYNKNNKIYLGINLPKEMQRYSIFLDWKNQYCENDCTTNTNYTVTAIPTKSPMALFHRTRTKHFTIHMETQKILNNQSSLEKEE